MKLSFLLLLTAGTSLAQAQSSDEANSSLMSREQLQARAQETDKGKALYAELVRNERARDGLGPSHPSVQVLNENIRGLEQQLLDWIDRPDDSGLPKKPRSKTNTTSRTKKPAQQGRVSATQDELLKVIAALLARIERLELRVQRLEASQ